MQDNGRIAFLTNGASQNASASFGFSERMSILQNGNVGMGTTSPSVHLQLDGTDEQLRLNQPGNGYAHSPYMTWFQNGVRQAYMGWGTPGANFEITAENSNALELETGGAYRLTILPNGNVGIGNTNPGQKLSVAGTIESTSGGIKFPDGTTQTTAASGGGGASNFQDFTTAGTATWTKPASGNMVYVQCWGAGGGGGRWSGGSSSGGGGGTYADRWIPMASVSSSVSVMIGTGGAGASSNGSGAAGGTTSFGSYVTAYGGGGGSGISYNAVIAAMGSGGGGALSAGQNGSTYNCNNGGTFPSGGTGYLSPVDTGAGSDGSAYYGGGGGGSAGGSICSYNGPITFADSGGSSKYGGGGGAGQVQGTGASGGTSLQGGHGGASGTSGTAGSQPGGGGGAANSGTAGAGGTGECRVLVY
jgi:hypothetical protein